MSLAAEWHQLRAGTPSSRKQAPTSRAVAARRTERYACPLALRCVVSAYDRGRSYAIAAALCDEGIAPELGLLAPYEAPDVTALAAELLRTWTSADEQRYADQVTAWLATWHRTDRWQRALRLLAYLRRAR